MLLIIVLHDYDHDHDYDIPGVADEWVEHKQFMPSLEMCAAKVSSPKLQELSIQKMPKKFGDVHDEVDNHSNTDLSSR